MRRAQFLPKDRERGRLPHLARDLSRPDGRSRGVLCRRSKQRLGQPETTGRRPLPPPRADDTDRRVYTEADVGRPWPTASGIPFPVVAMRGRRDMEPASG